MRFRHPRPSLAEQPSRAPLPAFDHVGSEPIALLGWLRASQVEFVLVGPVADAIRGSRPTRGPVSIVPAPYQRNFERLAGALGAEQAVARVDGASNGRQLPPARLTAAQLARGQHRTLRVGSHELDIEGGAAGMPSFQELLYEAGRFELAEGLSVEVASTEDIERYEHLRRTGRAPEIRITRAHESAPAPTEAHRPG
jgi:hypothetical protein